MKQKEITENLYLQFWRNPIFYKGLLASVNAEQWHTFTSLAKARYEGKPLIEISKKKHQNKSGTNVFANNSYQLNPQIVTIFAPHESTLACREQQMSKLEEIKAKFLKSHVISEKRDDDNLTRRSF